MVSPIDTKNFTQLNTDDMKHVTETEKITVLLSECDKKMKLVTGAFVDGNHVWAYTGELSDASYLFRLN